jgi:two-component system, cell cycle response regulator DivK
MSTILVIEDNASNARLVKKVLERQGHTVIVAPDGEQGLMKTIEAKPDLVLVDMGLPDIDGQTVIGLIRQQPDLNATRLIAFTAWPPDTAKEMAGAYGCDGVISKPIAGAALIKELDKYLTPSD